MPQKCSLHLSNDQVFTGELIGAPLTSSGELVFTTGMVGYSEAMTDPSYYGQILTFTYPLIGNYGFPQFEKGHPARGYESPKAQVAGILIGTGSAEAFHWNSKFTLDEWLKQQGVPGITGIDTRHLVHLLRSSNKLFGRIIPKDPEGDRFPDHQFFDPDAINLMPFVSTKKKFTVGKGGKKIALIDCGVKWNIVRRLIELGCEVEILPWNTKLSQIDCSAWVISNGPGDPSQVTELRDQIRGLMKNKRPILGICLGHQILSLAAGAATQKMPYGHRSHNQPVYEVGSRRAYLTTQNHGFAVVRDTIPQDWKLWFLNSNDESVEGIRHESLPFRSVQFHPEASGGPRDTSWVLENFVKEVKK